MGVGHCLRIGGGVQGNLFSMNRPAVRDAALLIFRAVLGLIFIAHGVDKMFMTGMDETVGQFSALGAVSYTHLRAHETM